MTQSAQAPELSYPRIMLLATDNISGDGSLTWEVGKPHPFVKSMQVVAIYVNGALVEIYSASRAEGEGMRDFVPIHRTRLGREAMPIETWAEELAYAEAGYPDQGDVEDEPDDDESDPDTHETVPPPGPNGQTSP